MGKEKKEEGKESRGKGTKTRGQIKRDIKTRRYLKDKRKKEKVGSRSFF